MKRIILYLVLSVFIVSCGSKRKVVTKKKRSQSETVTTKKTNKKEVNTTSSSSSKINSVDDYILTFKDIAQHEMQKSGIPASITLAQGILESGSGKGRLAVEANNHFGIKCHDWTGLKIYHDDDEKQECFRKYKNAETSFKDHSEFLTGRKRYAKLFTLKKNDYKGWAKELRKAGYATDKRYPQKLISLIERYQLYKYDEDVGVPYQEENSYTEHVVVKGDTLYSISKKYNLTVEKLKALNNLNNINLSVGQVLKVK
ncbi:MAG: LysM peptidoglycan-binding domain-containing protein [Flavobacteriaceae bacterium]|nr:glucosaminidase domain-containing protein [Bacteroidia bacterium]NNK83672.1 LysM peptidoglycan-binding domain-containing protein [Flavobacteriaceae bacterium]